MLFRRRRRDAARSPYAKSRAIVFALMRAAELPRAAEAQAGLRQPPRQDTHA